MRRTALVVLALTALIVAGCGDDDDDDTADADAGDAAATTVADAAPSPACAPWNRWLQTGDAAELDAVEAAIGDEAAAVQMHEMIVILRGEPTTPEGQEEYEAAVDTMIADLEDVHGCAPSRSLIRSRGG